MNLEKRRRWMMVEGECVLGQTCGSKPNDDGFGCCEHSHPHGVHALSVWFLRKTISVMQLGFFDYESRTV